MANAQSQAAHWQRQAAACRHTFAKTKDRFWAQACRSAISAARAHREQF